MSDGRPTPSRSRMPRGLLGMLALVAMTEAWVGGHGRDFATQSSECWRLSRRDAGHVAGNAILGFGTSLTKYGILPRALRTGTGRQAYNLAVFAGPLPASFFLFRHALDAGARPVAILVDCQDGAIPPDHRHDRPEALTAHRRGWAELLDLRDAIDLAWTARDAAFLGDMVASWGLPSYRVRFEARARLLAALQGRTDPSREAVDALRRNWAFNRGALMMVRNPPKAPAGRPGVAVLDPAGRPRRWPRNRLSLAYARRLVDLAESRGITVFWLMPPVSPDVQSVRDLDHEDYLTRVARMVRARGSNVVVVDGRHSGYPRGVFVDEVHLDRAGACRLSADVAEVIRRSLDDAPAPRRWVSLRRWRPLEGEYPLEDLGESIAAVGREASWR